MVHDVTSIKFNDEELIFDIYQFFSELKSYYDLFLDKSFTDRLLEKQVKKIDVEMDIILSVGNWSTIEELNDNIESEVIEEITELIKEKSLDEYIKEIGINDNEMENIFYDYCEDMIQRCHELGLEIGYGLLPHVTPIKIKFNGKYEYFLDLYDSLQFYMCEEEQLEKDFKLLIKVIESLPLFDEVKEIRKVVG